LSFLCICGKVLCKTEEVLRLNFFERNILCFLLPLKQDKG
jgi:hypothetical protein